jgi:uncharacterized protein YigE (DUF2233 family)
MENISRREFLGILKALGVLGLATTTGAIAFAKESQGDLEARAFKLKTSEADTEVMTFSFDPKKYDLDLALAEDYGQKLISMNELVKKTPGLLAAINGGFFEPNYEPSGLLVRDYQTIQPATEQGLRGVFLLDSNNNPAIIRNSQLPKYKNVKLALEAWPVLVENGRDNLKGTTIRHSYINVPRTTVSIDNNGLVHFHTFDRIGLNPLSAYMSKQFESTINLDGGPSTAIHWNLERDTQTLNVGQVQNYFVVRKK